MEQNNYHKNFKLNGFSFTNVDELLSYSIGFSDDIHQFLQEWFSIEDVVIVQTSGSTGTPKKIQLEKEQMQNSAFATGDFFNLKENTTALLCLPTQYIAGKMMLIRALTLGWHLDVVPSSSNPLETISKTYDFSAMVPLQVENSLNKLYLVKQLIVGGGLVSNQLQQKLQTLSTKIFATYGMTETITHIAIKKLNKLDFEDSKSNFGLFPQAQSRGYFSILPNTTIYIDERDCLVIKAPKVSKEIVFTNDVVRLISDTQFEWLGRFDNVINSGGIKLHPENIEERLSKIISQRFFVAGILDDKLGEKLVLIVELKSLKVSEFKSLLIEKIKNLKTLSKFEIPKEIYFADNFVVTETGKIQRKKTLQKIQTN